MTTEERASPPDIPEAWDLEGPCPYCQVEMKGARITSHERSCRWRTPLDRLIRESMKVRA